MTEQPEDRYTQQVEITNVTSEAPRRVVSLVPAMTETLFDLGFGRYVMGITDDCLYPAEQLEGKRRLGPVDSIRVDDVRGLRPDLVIVNREENAKADIEALEAAGLNVWKTFPRTVMEAMNLIWDVLHAFFVDDRMLYERVNLLNRTIDWVGGASEAREDRVTCKVFAPIIANPLTTFGPDTYTHDLLRVSGGTNIFGDLVLPATSGDPAEDVNRYPQVTLEDVVKAQPDVVLLPAYPYSFAQDDVEQYMSLDIPAAHTQQIYLIDGTLLTYHGTRLARALNEISELMCPVDIEEADDRHE